MARKTKTFPERGRSGLTVVKEYFGRFYSESFLSRSDAWREAREPGIYMSSAVMTYTNATPQQYPLIGFGAIENEWQYLVQDRLKDGLELSFVKQAAKFPEYIKDHFDEAFKVFFVLSKSLTKWNAITGKVSLTESPSLFFRSTFFGDYELRFEVFLQSTSAAFSLYRGKILVARNHGSLSEMLNDVEKLLNPLRNSSSEIAIFKMRSMLAINTASKTYSQSETEDTTSLERFIEHAY